MVNCSMDHKLFAAGNQNVLGCSIWFGWFDPLNDEDGYVA